MTQDSPQSPSPAPAGQPAPGLQPGPAPQPPAADPGDRIAPLDKVRMTLGILGALAGVSVILIMIVILAGRALTTPQIAGAKTPAERVEMLRNSRAQDHETLTTYGWVDRPRGIVRVPIEEAMQMYIARPTTSPATTQHQ